MLAIYICINFGVVIMNKKNINALTRADIASSITDAFDISRHEASQLVDDVFNIIALALVEDEIVKLSGFGTFSIRNKKERIGRNPKTLEEAIISSRKVVTFKSSKILKKAVNEGAE
jgi:integration host factor subunit alpha